MELATDPARIGLIGKRLGRFHILSELGRGGMATVYRARDPELGRDVAVKVLHGFFAGRADVEARFRREATVVAGIRHPSILALYDFAPPAGEEPGYIVSELIEGPGLRRLIEDRGGRLMPEVATLIAIRVAEALGAAHSAGIVHRDVKPDNVLIDRAGGAARVVLTDFGVAHVGGVDTMTATGAVLGSPAYMSPEQARGADVGPPSDVFSLGVLLYQLCTGHMPFAGADPLMVIAALLRGDYLRPGKLEARVGPELEQIIGRCLQKDAAARFPDGSVVAAALRDNLAAAAAGFELADEDVALRRYLGDPGAFEREVSPKICAAARVAAEQARRRSQHPRALAEIGRALAYAPDDPLARELLTRIGSRPRPRWAAVGIAVTGVAVLAAALFALPRFAATGQRGTAGTGSAPTRTGAPLPPAPPRPHEPPAAAAGATRSDPPLAAASATDLSAASKKAEPVASQASPVRQRRGGGRSGTAIRTAAAGATVVSAARMPIGDMGASNTEAASDSRPGGTEVPGPAAGATRPENTHAEPGPTATEPATARVVLRASHGFCEPSLDGHRPSLRASYDSLAAGPHEIFCTLPQSGEKIHVATYELRAGTRPNLIIVPGPGGRPVLGKPE